MVAYSTNNILNVLQLLIKAFKYLYIVLISNPYSDIFD